MSGASAAEIVEAAKLAAGDQIALPHATALFTAELNSTVTVSINLEPHDKAILEESIGFTPYYKPTRDVKSDHKIMACMREIARNALIKDLMSTKEITTLFVGVGSFEIGNSSLYDNPANFFSIHGDEPKDTVRIVPTRMLKLMQDLKKKCSPSEKRCFNGLGY